eukprot:gene293-6707_t
MKQDNHVPRNVQRLVQTKIYYISTIFLQTYFAKERWSFFLVFLVNLFLNVCLSFYETKSGNLLIPVRAVVNVIAYHLIILYAKHNPALFLFLQLIFFKYHYKAIDLINRVQGLVFFTCICAVFSLYYLRYPLEEVLLIPFASYFFLMYYSAVSDAYENAINTLEKSNESREKFIRLLSHEIRTPLTSIISTCELMRENEKNDENLNNIHTSSSTLLRLLNNILNFSKGYSDKINFEFHIHNVKDALKNVFEMTKPIAVKKNLKLNLKIDEEISSLLSIDLSKLEQVFLNLIGNALKFTTEGSIDIELKSLKKNKENEEILFSVKDTGVGIEKEKISTIFEPFTQFDSSTSRKHGGIGLGLHISKQIIDGLNGELNVESQPNFGTKFSVILKLKLEKRLNIENENSLDIQKHNFEKEKILLCEDNSVNRLAIKKVLSNVGFNVDICKDGNELIQLYKKNKYKLIITDYHMPGMDGIEASKEIKKIDENVYIILLTADLMVTTESYECINEIITKPVIGKNLINRLSQIMS